MRNLMTSLTLILFAVLGAYAQSEEVGIASYYDDSFNGRKTASGELYNKGQLTAAHRTLPYGTVVLVTRLDNNKSVKVRINDRGPYLKGRIVDLSRAAAERLDIVNDGHTKVKIKVVGKGAPVEEEVVAAIEESEKPLPAKHPVDIPKVEEYSEDDIGIPSSAGAIKQVEPKVDKKQEPAKAVAAAERPIDKPSKKEEPVPPAAVALPESDMKTVTDKNFSEYDLYKVQLLRPEKAGFGVQVASMTQYEYVLKRIAELQGQWFNNILLNVEKGKDNAPVYKIILGPFGDRDTAESYKRQLKKNKKISGFVVDLSGEK